MGVAMTDHLDEHRLFAYAEGALDARESAAVRDHVAGCARCRSALRDLNDASIEAASLPVVAMPPARAERTRRALRAASRRPWRVGLRFAAAAATVLVVAVVAVWRPTAGLAFEPAAAPARLTAVAVDLHHRVERGELALDVRSDSARELRDWARAHTGRGVSLALDRTATEAARYVPAGAAAVPYEGEPAAAVVYRVDGRPVTLVVARDALAEELPRWGLVDKRVEVWRGASGETVFSWRNSGNAYALVSGDEQAPATSCFVCHSETGRQRAILDAFGR
jgi:hypothetical protein